MSNPFLLKGIIDWLVNYNNKNEGIYLLIAIVLVSIIKPFILQHGMRISFKVMTSCNIIFFSVYHKKLEKIS